MVIIVMGVSGAGKSTVGRMLAEALRWEFYEADAAHPPGNIEKMRRGLPLTDHDRAPWLAALRQAIEQWLAQPRNIVLACSALKRAYRRILCGKADSADAPGTGGDCDDPRIRWVYLKSRVEMIEPRLALRRDHFMNPTLLRDQFAILEEPTDAMTVDASEPPAVLVQRIRAALRPPT